MLTDNGSIFAAYRTLEIAAALNLEPCFRPVQSPESNGMAEAFVKTFKRDYVRVNPIPDASSALMRIDKWMEDYNSEHPHSRPGGSAVALADTMSVAAAAVALAINRKTSCRLQLAAPSVGDYSLAIPVSLITRSYFAS